MKEEDPKCEGRDEGVHGGNVSLAGGKTQNSPQFKDGRLSAARYTWIEEWLKPVSRREMRKSNTACKLEAEVDKPLA